MLCTERTSGKMDRGEHGRAMAGSLSGVGKSKLYQHNSWQLMLEFISVFCPFYMLHCAGGFN
jgi:hypothetical protein